MCSFNCGWCRRCNKKPTTVSSRGFLSKVYLTTIANGVVSYDDYQCDLSKISKHCWNLIKHPTSGQALIQLKKIVLMGLIWKVKLLF